MIGFPSVSVIVPCFNSARTLEETLDSIFTQTFPPFEVIVVNDGSTDQSTALLQRYTASSPERCIRVLEQKNRGVSAARNAGVNIAQGDLVCFLDADDLWHVDKLKLQVQALIDFAPDYQAVAVVGVRRFTVEQLTGKKSFFRDTWVDANLTMGRRERIKTILALANNEMASCSTVLCPRSVFLEVGGWDENLAMAEDWDLLIRLCEVLPLVSVPQPLLFYRKHSVSTTACYSDYKRLEQQQFSMLSEYSERSGLDRKTRHHLVARHLQDFLGLCSGGRGDRLTLLGLLARQIIYAPSNLGNRQFYRYLKRCIT